MASLWDLLSGEVPGGFALLLVMATAFLAILEFVYRTGRTLPRQSYRRWRWRGPAILTVLYALLWVQSPPRLEPLRLAVIVPEPASDSWQVSAVADLAARSLQRTLSPAVVNPWRGAADYPQPSAEILERAGYRVYRVASKEALPAAMRLLPEISLEGGEGHATSFTLSGGNLAALAVEIEQWILDDLGKEAALAEPFSRRISSEVLHAYYQGEFLMQTGQMDSALACLNAALLSDPTFTPARILTARYLETHGHRDHAAVTLRETVRTDSGSVEALLALGEFHLRGYEWSEAEAALKVALASHPRLARAQAGLACLHPERLKDLRLNTPEKLLAEAVRVDPAHEAARIAYADVLAGRGMQEDAAAILREGLRIDPKSRETKLKLGAVEIQLGHVEAAREIYEGFLKENSQDASAIFNLGVLDYRTKQYDRAIDRFRTVQGLNGPVDCLYYLGLIYQVKGDKSRAKFYFQRRWELRSGDHDAFGIKARDLAAVLNERSGG